MFIIISIWLTDLSILYIFILLVAISHEGVTYMCVLDKTDMNKHGQRRRGVDSIKRQSSDGEKQILLQTKPTVLNQTTEEKMNKYLKRTT